MRKTIKGKGLVGGIVAAVAVAGLAIIQLCGLIAIWAEADGTLSATFCVATLIAAAVFLAVAVGVVVALCHRWKEILGGEEDEAKKY